MNEVFRERLLEYAEAEDVFTTDDVMKAFAIPQEEKHNLNIELGRLCKSGKLYRYKRGMFGYEAYGEKFGIVIRSHCPKGEALAQLYLKDDGSYISGAEFYNKIGLSTWIPRKTTVVTNKVKRKTETDMAVILPPKAVLTKENRDYFQILDCFENFGKLAVDHPNPYGRIMWCVRKRELNVQTLVALAKRYYTKQTLEKLISCLEADYFERASQNGKKRDKTIRKTKKKQ